MVIKKLSSQIINQIAAGEVIENPAGVIKELVENSIDAQASFIEVELEDYGKKRIFIRDDGKGISKEDLPKAVLRHATSKISDFEDLYNVSSMGFRGEALASIFSIANVELISSTKNGEAYKINSKNLSEVEICAGNSGTSIEILDLFYNTPARKKYLKSDNLELKSILDIFKRFEIAYPKIKFSLKHNRKILVNKPKFDFCLENLYFVLGRELKDNIFEISEEFSGIKIKGFFGKPSNLSYSFKKNQFIFVNSRFIKSKLITSAVYEGFSSNLMVGRHPFFVVFLEIDPQILDVNVHPTKIEVRFENELEVFEAVKTCVKKCFEEKMSFKDFNLDEKQKIEQDLDLEKVIPILERKKVVFEEKPMSKYYSKEDQKSFQVREEEVEYIKYAKEKPEFDLENLKVKENGPLFSALEDFKVLGQINKTYIVVQTPIEMLLIDQHVAEEKYHFECFKRDFENKKKGEYQMLLKSKLIGFSREQMLLFKENLDLISSIGFVCEEFGENEVLVRGVPINIKNEIVIAENIEKMLDEILINKTIKCVEEENYSKLASMACRISVMAGHELSNFQMRQIVENLRYLKQPFNCPHGRPTFLRFSYKDLDKKFKRIV